MQCGISTHSRSRDSAAFPRSSSGTPIFRRWQHSSRRRIAPTSCWRHCMLMLRELQRAFVQGALSDSAPAVICAQIIGDGIAPERRLAIYRNNAVEGFLKTLQATFPTIVRLSGEDWFRQVGRQYMRRYPSRSGNIHYVGEHFATFLEAELSGSSSDYFADVARLEWAYPAVVVAADHPSLSLIHISEPTRLLS